MVDARHHQVRIPVLVLEFQAELDAGGRRGIQISPSARAFILQIFVGQLLHAKGDRRGHGTLMKLGSHHGHLSELSHHAGQDVDASGLISVVVGNKNLHGAKIRNITKLLIFGNR